jgi:tRNA dimethylallyltransferase
MNRLVAVVGPTGIGKSRLALHLAGIFHGEIVSADSRQLYRYLDIGTAKPTSQELSQIPHHLVNIADPDENFSLAQYQEKAYQAISEIYERRNLPFLVGGSGLYIWSVLEGWEIPRIQPDAKFRYNLEERAKNIGADALYQELVEVDPVAAQKIDKRNVRRVIRALEVHQKAEVPISRLQLKKAPDFNVFIIGLTADRAYVYQRIDARVDEMVRSGFVAEVEKLFKMGYDLSLPSMSGIGYRQIGQYLHGQLVLDEAINKIKTETHRFVRQQNTWFRLDDERIHWFDLQCCSDAEIEKELAKFLNGQ